MFLLTGHSSKLKTIHDSSESVLIKQTKFYELAMFVAVMSTVRIMRDGEGWLSTGDLVRLLPKTFWRRLRKGGHCIPSNQTMFLGQMLKALERLGVLTHKYTDVMHMNAETSYWRPTIACMDGLSLEGLPIITERSPLIAVD